MKRKLATIRQASQYFKIAEIRIWELIQQGVISTKIEKQTIFVDMIEIEEYFARSSEKLEAWQKNFTQTQANKTNYS